jgi:hypothetical protein
VTALWALVLSQGISIQWVLAIQRTIASNPTTRFLSIGMLGIYSFFICAIYVYVVQHQPKILNDSTFATSTSRFSLKNPNRLRSVVSVFISSPQFHLPDGSGYDFALEMIPKVDALNPQAVE